jgi:hypothetical protein
MADILDEVQEDLRHEQMHRLWQRYSKYIVMVALAIVLIAGGNAAYKGYQNQRHMADATEYTAAMDLADGQQRKEALDQLAKLDGQASSGYKTLSLFSEAGLKVKQNDLPGAIASYDKLASDSSLDSSYRELATVISASIKLDIPGTDLNSLSAQLDPLTKAGHPWRGSAKEVQALIAYKLNDKDKAQKLAQSLAIDGTTPPAMRERAKNMQTVFAY